MAKQENKKKQSRIKTKKKTWFKLLAPKAFGQKEIGEMYLATVDSAIGRPFKVSLKEITGNMKDQNSSIGFTISKVNGTVLETTILSYELNPAFVKRIVRKNIDRLDNEFSFTTKDGQKLVLKTLVLTRHKTHRSTRAAIQHQLEENLRNEISKMDLGTLFTNVTSYKIQLPLKRKLTKIYPLKEVAIRYLKVKMGKGPLKKKIVVEEVQEQKAEEQKAEA